jgi:hypothetical protein
MPSLRWSIFVVMLAATLSAAFGQTFRGTVAGTVVDAQGAVLPNAVVLLKNPATDATLNGKSNSAGEFNFPDLVPGAYSLTVSFPGFQTRKIDNINVEVTKVENERVQLSIGSENTIVDVTANAIQTDTTTSSLVAVIDSKSVADMPMNGRDFTKMTHFTPGAALLSNSVNGSRTTSINFQIDGVDNVDSWNGIVASNQGGVAGVAGGLVPIEAIDQFSMQSAGEAEQGRNAGANQNMVLKSGTNQIHGDVFYFDRNEFFAAISPVAPVGSRKPLIRNHQGGFTLGGPIWKDHTFLFLAGEIQIAKINTALTDTVLTDAWIANGTAFLKDYGINSANTLSTNLYNLLYPAASKGGAATTNNYFASGTSNYNSYNGLIKLDHHISDKQTISARYLGTTGTQTAPTASDYAQYFQKAPMHIHNAALIHDYIFNSRMLNQVLFGFNYFLQTFNDADQNFNPQANAGLNLGLPAGSIIAAGAPTIAFTGTVFDQTGATQPSGRTDVTGHVTDNFHWTLGRHELTFGGEYRHVNVNQLYFSSARGTFTFDGTRGPWSANAATDKANCAALPVPEVTSTGACNTNILALADFLNGEPTNSSGAKLLQGNAQRVWTLTTEDFYATDSFQVNRKLNLNYGIRYTIPGNIQAAANDVYSFIPGANPYFQLGLYPNYYKGVAPRAGFSFSPFDNNKTVVRGSAGLFYDFPNMSSWVTGSSGNGGAGYAQTNPAGPDAAAIYIQSNVQWAVNTNPFVPTPTNPVTPPQVGAYGVNQNFTMPYAMNFSFGLEQQLTSKTLLSVGYVGSQGRRLEVLYDLNQPVANGTSTVSVRPYTQTSFTGENTKFAGVKPLLGINQLNFEGSSGFNSMQATLKQATWKGLQATINYTWSHAMDDVSSSTTPSNSYNLHQDYGASTFDGRNSINGFLYYNMPGLFGNFAPRLTKGFQFNALYSYSTGLPINPLISTDNSLTDQLKDRPNVNPLVNPYTGLQLSSSTANGRQYRYFQNAGAFTAPAKGNYGNERRDAYYGPNFRTIDFSMIKRTPVTERVMSEFRVEIFNIFNFNNFANPSVSSITSSTFGLITNTRNGASAPGIGYGEPFNIQFALKFTF